VQLRARALERRKLPEELDQLSGLARPWTLLGVGALTIAVVVLVVWSFLGTIPRTVKATGVLAQPGGLAAVESSVSGPVESVLIGQGDTVRKGQPIAEIGPTQQTTITAPFAGRVVDLQLIPGEFLQVGDPLYTLQRTVSSLKNTSAYLFFPAKDGAGVGPGMQVNITVSTAPSAAFGVLHGKVASISDYPLSTAGVSALVANPDLARLLTADGPPLLAEVTLTTDASTPSGLSWSTPKGAPFPLQPGTEITAQIVESKQRPINVVFGT
jgi:multidrug efflux pump subunit AcrA (membrane-fusion protein)